MASSSKNLSSSKNKGNADEATPPTVSTIIPKSLITTKDFEEKFPSLNARTWAVCRYLFSIRPSNIPVVKEDCHCQDLDIIAPDLVERNFTQEGFYVFLCVFLHFGTVLFEWRA